MTAIRREKYMDKHELRRLRQSAAAGAALALQKGTIQGVLAWMLVDLALSTGLRVSEMQRLRIEDIDQGRCGIYITRSKKKSKTRELLAISPELLSHLVAYILWTSRKAGPLFRSQRLEQMSKPGLQMIWRAAIKRAGLPAQLSIHSARHSMAVALLQKTKNLRLVQKQLGHSSPITTASFYADVSFAEMQSGLIGLYDDDDARGTAAQVG